MDTHTDTHLTLVIRQHLGLIEPSQHSGNTLTLFKNVRKEVDSLQDKLCGACKSTVIYSPSVEAGIIHHPSLPSNSNADTDFKMSIHFN